MSHFFNASIPPSSHYSIHPFLHIIPVQNSLCGKELNQFRPPKHFFHFFLLIHLWILPQYICTVPWYWTFERHAIAQCTLVDILNGMHNCGYFALLWHNINMIMQYMKVHIPSFSCFHVSNYFVNHQTYTGAAVKYTFQYVGTVNLLPRSQWEYWYFIDCFQINKSGPFPLAKHLRKYLSLEI